MAGGPKITDAEIDDWRRVYPTGGAAAVRALYPHRSKNCIAVTCHRRGIKMIDPVSFRRTHLDRMHAAANSRFCAWTAEQDEILRNNLGPLGSRGVMWMLPFRTYGAIRTRGYGLGLTFSQLPKPAKPQLPTPKRDRLKALFAAGQQVSA